MEEILLREYCGELACGAQVSLFEEREHFRDYLARGWLTLSFDDETPCVRASHFVGLMPYHCAEGSRLVLVAPKGCRENQEQGLLHFLELLAICNGQSAPPLPAGYQGVRGAAKFLVFLAFYYAHLLRELCRRDFRLYYRAEEGGADWPPARAAPRGGLHAERSRGPSPPFAVPVGGVHGRQLGQPHLARNCPAS